MPSVFTRLLRLAIPALVVLGGLAGGARADDAWRGDFDAAWTIVAETHFDTTYGGVDWTAVRDELRPRALAAPDRDAMRAVIGEMLARLGQSHFELIPGDYMERREEEAPGGSADPGFEIRVIDGDVVVFRVEPGSPADAAGVRPGWIVRRVGEHVVADVMARVPETLSDSRRAMEQWVIASRMLTGAAGETVTYQLEDGAGAIHELPIGLVEPPGEIAQLGFLPPFRTRLTWKRLPDATGGTVGLIRFNVWMLPAMAAFDEAVDSLRTADGIIIDLRGNVGGVAGMLIGTAGHFYTEPTALGTLFARDQRFEFRANPRRVNRAGKAVEPYAGPVAILVDRHSYSASEFFAGGMQATGRAHVFGQPSDGWALGATFDKLPGGDVLEHAVSDFTTADGRRIEGAGVIPDVTTPLTREDLLNGVDAPLEAARRWIEEESKREP